MPCSVNDQIADGDEAAELAIAMAMGVSYQYTHMAEAPVIVYLQVISGEQKDIASVLDTESEVVRMVVRVAQQETFPPAAGSPFIDDYFTIDGHHFYIKGSQKNPNADIWDLQIEKTQPRYIE